MNPLEAFVRAQNPAPEATPEVKVETPTEVKTETKVEAKVEATPEPVKTESPKVEVKAETKAEPELIDLEVPDTTEQPKTDFDFSSLIKDIGIEAKTKEELVSKYKEAVNKEDSLKGVPDNLRKAVEFAKQGGDYLQMLKVSQIDYSQIDPTVVYEQHIYNNIQDKAKAKEYLDSLTPLAKEFEGIKLKNQHIQWQESQERSLRAELEQKAAKELVRKAENEKRLKETVNKVDNVHGFKVKQSEKDKFVKEVLDGSLSKELFMDEQGEFDYKKMMEVRFIHKNFDAIKSHFSKKIETATQRAIIEPLVNAELQINTEKPSSDKIEFNNPMDAWINQSKKGK